LKSVFLSLQSWKEDGKRNMAQDSGIPGLKRGWSKCKEYTGLCTSYLFYPDIWEQ
jgi:hypothetical protein